MLSRGKRASVASRASKSSDAAETVAKSTFAPLGGAAAPGVEEADETRRGAAVPREEPEGSTPQVEEETTTASQPAATAQAAAAGHPAAGMGTVVTNIEALTTAGLTKTTTGKNHTSSA